MTIREQELASALEHCTNPSDPEYDADFDKQIRQLRPDWFVETEEELPPIKEQRRQLVEVLERKGFKDQAKKAKTDTDENIHRMWYDLAKWAQAQMS
jgi:hypothetical protein